MSADEIPDGPLLPETAGALLHAILNPPPSDGPPFTHTFRLPAAEDGVREPPWTPLSLDALTALVDRFANLPPRPSVIRVHPDDWPAMKEKLAPAVQAPSLLPATLGLSVPIRLDESVRRGTIELGERERAWDGAEILHQERTVYVVDEIDDAQEDSPDDDQTIIARRADGQPSTQLADSPFAFFPVSLVADAERHLLMVGARFTHVFLIVRPVPGGHVEGRGRLEFDGRCPQ